MNYASRSRVKALTPLRNRDSLLPRHRGPPFCSRQSTCVAVASASGRPAELLTKARSLVLVELGPKGRVETVEFELIARLPPGLRSRCAKSDASRKSRPATLFPGRGDPGFRLWASAFPERKSCHCARRAGGHAPNSLRAMSEISSAKKPAVRFAFGKCSSTARLRGGSEFAGFLQTGFLRPRKLEFTRTKVAKVRPKSNPVRLPWGPWVPLGATAMTTLKKHAPRTGLRHRR